MTSRIRHRSKSKLRLLWGLLVVVTSLELLGGCKRSPPPSGAEVLPPFAVRENSQGLLFTWIDEKGEFHVESQVADVPPSARDVVRVVDPERAEGTHPDRVFVYDLRAAGADGNFPARVLTRAEFETIAIGRRSQRGPTLANPHATPDAESPGAPPPGPLPDPGVGQPSPAAQAIRPVVIYGASWCGPCHQAAAYLRQKGVPFVEKDIEEDPGAAREMQAKLAKSGRRGGSIPVIDVRGKILVGFSPSAVEEALGQAL